MSAFVLVLQDAAHREELAEVASFVGEDASGSFGIQGGHAELITVLEPGLARFRHGSGPWQYVALAGGVLHFRHPRLTLSTRHYLRGADPERLAEALEAELRAEEARLAGVRRSLEQLESELRQRLWELGRRVEP